MVVSRANIDVPATGVGEEADRRVRDKYGPLVAFVRMRSQAPEGQEYTQNLPQNYKRVYNLHAGDDRAVTWWDRERDIVWLLAAGFHRSGQRDDFYPRVVQMDGRGALMPTGDDFFAAEICPDEQFITELARHGRELVAEAREHPGTEHARTVVSRARMGAHVELLVDADDRAEELWLAVRPLGSYQSSDLVADVLAHVLTDAPRAAIDFPPGHPTRQLAPGERVVRWTIS